MANLPSLERILVSLVLSAPLGASAGAAAGRFLPWPAALLGGLAVVAGAGHFVSRRLPPALDGCFRRRKVVAGLWALAALAAVAQSGRMAAFMVDGEAIQHSALPDPFTTRHSCQTAYVLAADAALAGAPLYGGDRSSFVDTAPFTELDPYQYPPTFLPVSAAVLRAGGGFAGFRTLWFALTGAVLGAALLLLATASRSAVPPLLLPVVWVSIPTLISMQIGNAHLLVLAMVAMAWMAMERGRPAGGLLLGAAIGFKLFPGLLVVPLLLQRRWREVAWTAGGTAVLAVASLAWFGTGPWVDFVREQLPRLSSGEAFAPIHAKPIALAADQSAFGLVLKLGGSSTLARGAAALFSLGILGLALRHGRRTTSLLGALALLNLAALASPFAPFTYLSVGHLLVLALVAAELPAGWRAAVPVAAGWMLLSVPLPPALSIPVQVGAWAINGWLVRRASLAAGEVAAPALSPQRLG